MKRAGCLLVSASLLIFAVRHGHAADAADVKLAAERQIVHVLNRLTFGPTPADIEQVRRIGIDAWIDQQLHPERLTEDPALEAKLRQFDTLDMPTWQLLEKYPVVPPALVFRPPSFTAFNSLAPQQRTILLACSAQERQTMLSAFDPETRRLIVAAAPPQALEGLPDDLVQEGANTRKAEQEARQKELRRLMPPLNELLSPDQVRTVTSGSVDEKVSLLDSLATDKRRQVIRALPPAAYANLPAVRREALAANQPQVFVNDELIEQKVLRAIYSRRQLEEVLVDFWMNHFNVFNGKGQDRVLLTSFERDAIRPYVFGRFRDMLLATARHPAMLFYLDNWQSQAPREDLPVPAGIRRPGLNENYGRELLELHTLGVNGGYTQDDVIAVARAFTGWTIYDVQKFAEFQFNPGVHDRREKVVLGHTIPAMQGEQDGVAVIDILARHPSTAQFISRKLAQRFVADEPSRALVDRMAATYMSTDGDLRAVIQTMLKSPEFLSEQAWHAKLKSPLEMVVSSVRAINADVTDAYALAQRVADLGEPLYGKLEPSGYPNTNDAWTNTATIMGRINFASALSSGQVPGVKVDISRFNFKAPTTVAKALLATPPSSAMLAAIEQGLQGTEATPSMVTALVLGSPDFQRR